MKIRNYVLPSLLFLSGCASKPVEIGDAYSLTPYETIDRLDRVRSDEIKTKNFPSICNKGELNEFYVFINEGDFMVEEYWVKKDEQFLTIGVRDDYSKKIYQFKEGGLVARMDLSYVYFDIKDNHWYDYWFNSTNIESFGNNWLNTEKGYKPDDEMIENIGASPSDIFLEPAKTFLHIYNTTPESNIKSKSLACTYPDNFVNK